MQIPGRNYNPASGYRFAFNGKEMDSEVSGHGNQYDYGFRIYNPRLGRFLSVDPLTKSYPWYTPYQFAGNKPIWAIDLDGLEEVKFMYARDDKGYRIKLAYVEYEWVEAKARSQAGQFVRDIKLDINAWWDQWIGKDVLQFTVAEDASVVLYDRTLDGEEATLLDYGLIILPIAGGKLLKKAEYLKYLKLQGASDNVARAIVDRGNLRKALRIGVGVEKQAHHIIPVNALKRSKVVQDAVDAGLPFNSVTNGIPIPNKLHGSHKRYTEFVERRLNSWLKNNTGYTPDDARKFIQNELIPEMEDLIDDAIESGEKLNDYFKKLE